MAKWSMQQFVSFDRFLDHMNGALIGGVNISIGAALDGLTLIINAGAGNKTVTFAPVKNRNWTISEILAQIAAADPSLVGVASTIQLSTPGSSIDMRLRLFMDGALIVRSTGTSNLLFGFSAAADTTQAIVANTDLNHVFHDWDGQNRIIAIFYA